MAEYDAFISYRRSDGTAAARRIRQMLQGYRLPRSLRAGRRPRLTVFLDTAYERGAADFYSATIRPALLASRWLVVVATPDAVQRQEKEDWIAREVADFAAGPNGGNVVVVRAIGEFMAKLPADIGTRFPNVQIVDLRDHGWLGRLSPQRAARVAGEKLKLMGPIHDIALEDMPRLRREEERRQVNRLGAVAGVAVATVIMVAGLSLFALKSQWDGNQALRQSLAAARASVTDLVAQYAPDEALRSPTRDIVLRNCDLAERLRQLSGAGSDPDQKLACNIEQQRALALLATPQPGQLEAIAEALKEGEARALANGFVDDRALPVVLAGLRTWMALEAGNRASDAPVRYAAFQRAYADTLLQRADDSRDQQDIPYRNANTALHAAWQATEDMAVAALGAGDNDAAHSLFVQASADALRVDETLQKVRMLAPNDATIVSFWSTLASMVQQSAAGEAQALVATDRAAADAAFARAAAYFERPQEQDFASPYRRKAWAAVVAGTEVALDDEPRAGEPISDAIWACLENGHAVVADTSVTSDDYDRQQASDVLNGCLDTVARQIDARRQEVNRLWNAGQLEDAAGLLRLVIADEARINGLREYSGPWNDLYLAIAQRDLATIENQAGDETTAAAARQAAMTLFQPYLSDMDYIDDTATHVALAKAALADVQAAEAAARARAAGQASPGTAL